MSESDSRSRILDAALEEFSAVGFAGARVDTIARLAGCNKQLIYHYFKDKNGLYEAVIERVMSSRPPFDFSGKEPVGVQIFRCVEELLPKRQRWLRMLMWEALTADDREVPAEEIRKEHLRRDLESMRKAQAEGAVSSEVDAPFLMLAMMGMSIFPFAFPQVVRVVTGMHSSDPEFRRRYAQTLKALVGRFLRREEGAA